MTTAAIQSLDAQLQGMVGKTYMVNTVVHKVLNFRISDEKLLIGTNKRFFEVDLANSQKTLEMFLETEDEPERMHQVEVKSLAGAGELKDILMDNIRLLKGNPGYIPQAQAINESVKVLTDLAKTEVNMLEVLHKIRISS